MKAKIHRDEVLQAIRDLNEKVTVADIVSKTGVSIEEAASHLNAIAAATDATLLVSDRGEIFYQFTKNFYYAYLTSGLQSALMKATGTLLGWIFYLYRISFGVVLIVSLWTIMLCACVFQSITAAGSGLQESAVQSWNALWTAMKLLSFAELNDFARFRQKDNESEEQGLILASYSFVFGDGRPNKDFEKEKLRLVAQLIRLNEGVLLSEHLAPYTGHTDLDEKPLFEILARFHGIPVVSDGGDIVYLFPKLHERSEQHDFAMMPPMLELTTWKFSRYKSKKLQAVGKLIAANIIAWALIAYAAAIVSKSSSHPILYLILGFYLMLYVAVPLCRYALVKLLNLRIANYNQRVREYERSIGSPSSRLAEQLQAAEAIRREEFSESRSSVRKIVYTTSKDALEQMFDS